MNNDFIAYFDSAAKSFSENVALRINGVDFSYAELATEVERISQKFASISGTRIGVVCDHSFTSYATIIACWKAQKSYVPIHPQQPLSRIKEICSTGQLAHIEGQLDLGILTIDFQVENEAYVLFTSGSSGKPKGVPISVENVNHFIRYFIESENYVFCESDKFLQVFDLTFDMSVFSFFIPLCIGATCVVLPQNQVKFLDIAKVLADEEITVYYSVPSFIKHIKRYFSELTYPSLRYSIFAGEQLPTDLVLGWKKCVPNAVIENTYGLTETTVVFTSYRITGEENSTSIPIGKPFEKHNIILIDGEKNEGQMCVSGPQVFKGYLDDDTSEKWVEKDGKSFFATGDWVKRDEDGICIFVERRDRQVKINGYRIELEDVNAALRSVCEGETHCLVHEVYVGVPSIVAFATSTIIRSDLEHILPSYMLPEKFVEVDEIPLNSSGKVNERELLNLLGRQSNNG